MKHEYVALNSITEGTSLPTSTSPDIRPLALDDPPSAVRQHISDVLHYRHEVAREKSDAVASVWQLGLGLNYHALSSLENFNERFGEEYGGALYTSAVLSREVARKKAVDSFIKEGRVGAWIFFAVFLGFWAVVGLVWLCSS